MKKWKCSVCGYIHEGDEPPETCPVCGAPRDKFVEISEEEARKDPGPQLAPPKPKEPTPAPSPGLYGLLTGLMVKQHAHPITVHVPNGVLPAAVLFLGLGTVLEFAGLTEAAFYNLVFVLLAMPVALFSGYVDWQAKYKGALTKVFKIKIACGVVVLVLGVLLVLWRLLMPELAAPGSWMRWPFLGLHLLMLGAAGVAGEFGGRLVFGKK